MKSKQFLSAYLQITSRSPSSVLAILRLSRFTENQQIMSLLQIFCNTCQKHWAKVTFTVIPKSKYHKISLKYLELAPQKVILISK